MVSDLAKCKVFAVTLSNGAKKMVQIADLGISL